MLEPHLNFRFRVVRIKRLRNNTNETKQQTGNEAKKQETNTNIGKDHGRMDGWVDALTGWLVVDDIVVCGAKGRGIIKGQLKGGKCVDRVHSEPR